MRIRAVGVTLPAFDPFLGAKLSMCTTSWLGWQIPRKGSRRCLNRLANLIDHALDQCSVVALSHHADQGLGARLPDHQAASPLQLRFGRGNPLPHAVGLERLDPAVEAHVLEELR